MSCLVLRAGWIADFLEPHLMAIYGAVQEVTS